MNIVELKEIYSSKSIRQFSSSWKKLYKNILVELFNRIIYGEGVNEVSTLYLEAIDDIKSRKYSKEFCDTLLIQSQDRIDQSFSVEMNDDNSDLYIEFAREIIDEILLRGIVLVDVKKLRFFYSDWDLFNDERVVIEDWILLEPNYGLHFAEPERIMFLDFYTAWNNFMESNESNIKLFNCYVNNSNLDGYYHDVKATEIQEKCNQYLRILVFTAINVIDTYLNNLLLNIETNKRFTSLNEKISEDLKQKFENLKVEQIFEDVIFNIYPKCYEIEEVCLGYKMYQEIKKYRNSYVHVSLRNNKEDYSKFIDLISLCNKNIPDKILKVFEMLEMINNLIYEEIGINTMNWCDSRKLLYIKKTKKDFS